MIDLRLKVRTAEVESRTQHSRPRPRTQKKIRGQGLSFRGQTLTRPRTAMVEAKDQGHNFSKLLSVNFLKFLNVEVLKMLHFVKFLMIIQK